MSRCAAAGAAFAQQSLQDVPIDFCAPDAPHRVRLRGHNIGFVLHRSRRRSIGFVIGPQGLRVRAPPGVALADIELALRAKGDWIVRKLHEQHQRVRRLHAARMRWQHGAALPFLGEPLTLQLDHGCRGVAIGADRTTLHVGLPADAVPAHIRDAVQGWLQHQARSVFEARCGHFAPRLGVQVRRLALSSAATRWGSARADGSIRLNWRLVHLPPPAIDYVVVHELAHLQQMNHSPAFWSVVRSVLPDFERARDTLRTCALPVLDDAQIA